MEKSVSDELPEFELKWFEFKDLCPGPEYTDELLVVGVILRHI